MPQKPNKLLRIVVPVILALVGVGIGVAVLINSSNQGQGRPTGMPVGSTGVSAAPQDTKSPAAAPVEPPTDAAAAPTTPPTDAAQPPADDTPTLSPAPAPTPPTPAKFTAQTFPVPAAGFDPIGSLDPASGYEMEITISPFGAGINSLSLTNEFTTIYKTEHERLQIYHPHPQAAGTGVVPFAIAGVEVNGLTVPLGASPVAGQSFWRQVSPGVFEAIILDEAGAPAYRVTRQYELEKDSYDLIVRQGVQSLAVAAANIRWFQFGPVDLPIGSDRLGMDKRRVRFGYLSSPQIDPTRQIVEASKFLIERPKTLGKATFEHGLRQWPGVSLWPNADSVNRQFTLAWVGMTSRHFGVMLHPLVDPSNPHADKSLHLASGVHSFVLPGVKEDGSDATVALTLESPTLALAPGATLALDTGIYAGPLSRRALGLAEEPRAAAMQISKVIVYTLGGPCGFCTFQSLTGVLSWFLNLLHDYILFDYALGIILLVMCMRGILHPVTRHAQISMQRFSKQMQALAPKQKKIQERYANDQQKMREEMARLMREEHISYSSAAKGCLTPLLQTPVWIALYAMLWFMFELRHEPAFFGVFQWISQKTFGVKWSFLADLSEPDRFIPFGTSFNIPVLSSMFLGRIDGINILPLLLGVVFYIQQKYMTPPSATPLTPEQQQQQKMMKIITVVMFPLFMYAQPAALTLYFVVNSTLGIFESRYIRRHAEKMDLLKPPPPRDRGAGGKGGGKNEPSKPGFFARMQALAEAKQKELERRQKDQPKRKR